MCLLTGSTLYLCAIFICDPKSGIDRTFMKYELNGKNTVTGIKNQIGSDKLKKLSEQIRTQFNKKKDSHI